MKQLFSVWLYQSPTLLCSFSFTFIVIVIFFMHNSLKFLSKHFNQVEVWPLIALIFFFQPFCCRFIAGDHCPVAWPNFSFSCQTHGFIFDSLTTEKFMVGSLLAAIQHQNHNSFTSMLGCCYEVWFLICMDLCVMGRHMHVSLICPSTLFQRFYGFRCHFANLSHSVRDAWHHFQTSNRSVFF